MRSVSRDCQEHRIPLVERVTAGCLCRCGLVRPLCLATILAWFADLAWGGRGSLIHRRVALLVMAPEPWLDHSAADAGDVLPVYRFGRRCRAAVLSDATFLREQTMPALWL